MALDVFSDPKSFRPKMASASKPVPSKNQVEGSGVGTAMKSGPKNILKFGATLVGRVSDEPYENNPFCPMVISGIVLSASVELMNTSLLRRLVAPIV